jgi:hypothetical protein
MQYQCRILSRLMACCLYLPGTFFTAAAFGQSVNLDNTNMTPAQGAGHNYIQSLAETVNPANGSVSVRIGTPAPKERGLNQPIEAYIYDSNGHYNWDAHTVSHTYTPSDPSSYIYTFGDIYDTILPLRRQAASLVSHRSQMKLQAIGTRSTQRYLQGRTTCTRQTRLSFALIATIIFI